MITGLRVYRAFVWLGLLLYAASGAFSVGFADVTSSGLNTVVSQSSPGIFNVTGGTRPGGGANLFHSFGNFSLNTPERANFLNNSGLATTNILSRVTGGNPSNIFGTIDTTAFPGANLFLMNPAGILFGPTAQLNVAGSFHATTADYIRLDDGRRFNAVPSGADALLTVAAPAAFGFLKDAPGPINVQTGVLNVSNPAAQRQFTSLLQVPVGKTISFVGGALNIAPPASGSPPPNSAFVPLVLAPGGIVNLVSVASPGEVTLNPIDTSGFAKLGDVNMSGGSVVDAREIFVRSGRLVMADSALAPFFARTRVPTLPPPTPDGGQVDIRVSDEVRIEGFTQVGGIVTPGIRTFAGVTPTGSFDRIGGEVPSILIDANSLSMRGPQASIRATRDGPGAPGKIEINADTVTLEGRSTIGALNRFAGPGTPVTVNSRTVSLLGDSTSAITGIFSQGDFNPTFGLPGAPFRSDFTLADSGPITINAIDKLTVVGPFAQITSDSFGLGASSKITLNVGDALFSGQGALAAQSLLTGTSGSITVNASGQVNIQGGFRVTAATFGSGDAGTINITANGGVNLNGTNSRIQSTTFQERDALYNGFAQRFAAFFGASPATFNYAALRTRLGVAPGPGDLMQVLAKLNALRDSAGNPLVAVTDFTPGTGGSVSITAPVLTASAGALIESSTAWDGNAGQINANVGSLFLNDGASISSTSGRVNLVTLQPAVGSGNAGDINLTASDTISISGARSTISTTTFGNGNAGSISLSANKVDVQSGGGVTSESGGSLAGQFFAGTGNAGQIAVSTPTLAMTDGGRISVATLGAGSAGSILLNANTLSLAGGSQVVSSTSGSGQGGSVGATAGESIFIFGSGSLPSGLFSTASSTGNAGQISVSTPTLTMGDGGTISVATSGAGNAGNVFLNASNFSLTGGAQIVSNTSGAGQGGSVSANASQSAAISGQGSGLFSTASSTGNAGQINLSTPTLTMGDSGTISVATSGAGNAGNIALNVTNFTQTGGARVDSSTSGGGLGGDVTVTALNSASMSGSGTGLFSTASSTGAGGDIKIQGGQLVQLTNNATVSAQSTGTATATAGNIAINAPTFEAQNGSVTTGATLADGGNIAITTTGSLVQLTNSQITTSVRSGEGSGGNIAIDSQLIVLNDSQILANAFGGPGGNINITGDVFLVNSGGRFPTSLTGIVDASSALSAPGTVDIEARFTNVVGTFAQLPSTPLQATELLRASCAARFAGGKASSLVLGGRDGLPLQPGDLLPSPLHVASDTDTPSTGNKVTGQELPTRFSLLGSKDRGLNQYSLLPNAKCSL
jgi:filamentous hemagglutinin family protein